MPSATWISGCRHQGVRHRAQLDTKLGGIRLGCSPVRSRAGQDAWLAILDVLAEAIDEPDEPGIINK